MRSFFGTRSRTMIFSLLLLCCSLLSVAGVASAHPVSANPDSKTPPHSSGSGISVTPKDVVLSSDGSGYAYFQLLGKGLPAAHTYLIQDSFSGACTSDDLNGDHDTTDLNGRFLDYSASSGCVPGTYTITAFDLSYPYDSHSTTVVFLSPRN